uniref:Uncharacterized protein n=1 Tax=Arundo donax TaxID=35708 RepID=A0A0A9FYT7_ARUDO
MSNHEPRQYWEMERRMNVELHQERKLSYAAIKKGSFHMQLACMPSI